MFLSNFDREKMLKLGILPRIWGWQPPQRLGSGRITDCNKLSRYRRPYLPFQTNNANST